MKHITILVAAAALLVSLGIVTGREYVAYQNREHARVNSANAQVVAQQKEAAADQASLVKRANALYDQCQVGVADYNLLPAATRTLKTTVKPDCGLPIVQ